MTVILVPSASHNLTDYLLSSEGVSCYNIFGQLERFGYEFEAVAARVNIKKPLKNVHTHQVASLESSPTSDPIRKYVNHTEVLVRSYHRSREILKKKKVDIIHHMLPAVYNQTFDLLSIFRKNRKQPFVFGPVSAHVYPRPLDEKCLKKVTSTLHGKTVKNCDQIITISDQVRRLYAQVFDESRIQTIPLGVDVENFKAVKQDSEGNGVELLFVGYLYRLKGIEYLLKAMQMVSEHRKDVMLRIVGDGPDKQRLVRLAEELKIKDNVLFEGLVPHNLMPRYYQQCDIFCFPTLGEPFGKAIIEAMACAKPVVASNIGGPAEIVENEKNGFLVPPAKPKKFASKIIELLDDETKRKQMATNARKTAVEKYSWTKIAEKYNEMYMKIKQR